MDGVSVNKLHSAFITDETRGISEQKQVSVIARFGVYRCIHPEWHYSCVRLCKTRCRIYHRRKRRASDQETSNIWLCFCSAGTKASPLLKWHYQSHHKGPCAEWAHKTNFIVFLGFMWSYNFSLCSVDCICPAEQGHPNHVLSDNVTLHEGATGPISASRIENQQ